MTSTYGALAGLAVGADTAAGSTSGGGGSILSALFFPVLLIAAFYFLILRPQRNRARQAQTIQQQMEPGAEVVTTSGLYGQVVEMDDEAVILEVAPEVELRFVRSAISRVVAPAEPLMDDEGFDEAAFLDEPALDEPALDQPVDGEPAHGSVLEATDGPADEGVDDHGEGRPQA